MKVNKIYYPIFGVAILAIGIAIWQKKRIVRHAKKFLGIDEIGDNAGWNDPDFEKKLKSVGWTKGAQWCVFFAKAMFADVYPELKTKVFNGKKIIDYITGSSQETYANMQKLEKETGGMFKVVGAPRPGDLIVWQNYDKTGKPQSTGHVGIVTKVKGDTFSSIEGNTSELGNTQETVNKKEHSLGEFKKTTGLRLKGFVHYTLA